MGFTSFLHLAGFLSFPIRLKALDLGRSNRTGNFRPKICTFKKFCWGIHGNPLFWDIGRFFVRNSCSKTMARENKGGKQKLQILSNKGFNSQFFPGSRFCASLTTAPHGAGPWQQVYAVICWKEAQVSPRMALMRQVLSAPAPWREVPKLGHWDIPKCPVVDGAPCLTSGNGSDAWVVSKQVVDPWGCSQLRTCIKSLQGPIQ